MRGFRGPGSRPQSTTGDPKVDRALRELGEPADLDPTLRYDKNGLQGVAQPLLDRIAALEERQPPHRMLTAHDDTGGEVLPTLPAISGSGADTAINNAFATLQAQIDRLHAIGVERGQIQ